MTIENGRPECHKVFVENNLFVNSETAVSLMERTANALRCRGLIADSLDHPGFFRLLPTP